MLMVWIQMKKDLVWQILVLNPHFKFKHEVILDEKIEKELEPYSYTIDNKNKYT
jgi:hypothetical protein